MRVLVVAFAACVASVMSNDIGAQMKKFGEECAKEHKVDMSVFKPGQRPDPEIFKNKEYRCFGKCVVVKAGLSSEDGEPNIAKIKEMFKPDDAAIGHIKTCAADNKQEDSCDRLFEIQQCIMKNIKQ